MFGKKVRGLAAAAILGILSGIFVPGPESRAEEPRDLFTEEEQAFIDTCGTLKVGYVQDRKPVSFLRDDGELGGISRYVFDSLEEISGLDFEYVALPYGSVTYDYLQKEGFDLVTGVEYNKENQKARGILISDPYLSSRKVIVGRDNLVFDSSLPLSVAISTGSQTIKKVLGEQFPHFKIKDYDTIADCFDAVNRGEADILIQNQYVVEYWLYRPSYENLKVIPVVGLDDQLCFSAVVTIEFSDVWTEKELLIQILNKSIDRLTEDEVADFIIRATMENQYDYTAGDIIYKYRYTFMVLAAAFILTLVLIAVIFNLWLRSVRAQADAKAKGDFLSAMSHEIRTPLNGLVGLNYLMAQNLDNRERLAKYLLQFSATADYLLSLVNNILDMSRLKDNELELEQEPLDLSLLLDTVNTIVMGSMEEKKIDFRINAEISHERLLGDAIRIQQVILNILDNARKFTPEGGHITVTVAQETTEEGQIRTRIDVQDTGLGMSEDFQHKIFDTFTQERKGVSSGNQGAGLGMSISYLLAQHMGGSLSVASKKGSGSCFTFVFLAWPTSRLPKDHRELLGLHGGYVNEGLARNDADDMVIGSDLVEDSIPEAVFHEIRLEEADDETPDRKQKILVAEDNELNAEILMELLEEEGIETVLAENGRVAVERFSESAPGEFDLILMDILMPEMNGLEAARAIRAMKRPDAKTIRIFACTANAFREDMQKAMESGMNDFITKPVDVSLLMEKIRK